jgi:hypothetical protein
MEEALSRRSSILMSVDTRTAPSVNGNSCQNRQDRVEVSLDDRPHGRELALQAAILENPFHAGHVMGKTRCRSPKRGNAYEDDGHSLPPDGFFA